ncbi:hypothetical protein FOMPIDRAFT_54955 [Fomitopsis schrenkii]|uniref:Cytochrome P450 n=1 Tax=Fomitopsis schrenkii TaxID=2126942 RepID=S8ECY9_FOMSC|nr:hypothetical protein FOMPIDRAFT_54955 [Fomitopsis schrenkii]
MASSIPLEQLIAIAVVVLLVYRFIKTRRRLPYPPGPRGWPIVGNIFDIPTEYQWKTFAQWGEKYGPIMSVSILGQRMVIINSAQVAVELLDRKSSIYSDRPHMVMIGEMVGWTRIVSLHNYGPRFRETRRLLSQMLGSREKVAHLAPLLEAEEHRFLLRVMRDPGSLVAQVRKAAGSIILMLAYGYEVQDDEDPYVAIVEKAMSEVSRAAKPAAFLVDFFPILKYVPTWFPGARWKRQALLLRSDLEAVCDIPFEFTKQQMNLGQATNNFVAINIEGETNNGRESILKDAAASMYAAGADTTVSAICSFVIAMMCSPDAQAKAQAEIDRVVGSERLPSLSDREQLPYVRALTWEVLRWQPIAPLGVPHRLTQDDVHNGYFIPKGTTVITNIWGMLRDPARYPEPDSFNPDRFLPLNGAEPEYDPRHIVFGFGRRVCPGSQLAETSLFIICALTLAVFRISKPIIDGRVVEPSLEYTTGTISHPLPFACSITPRSPKAAALAHSVQGSSL